MSEEPKNIRISKAAKEFNVGISTLVEFLAKKGHQVEATPNAKITPEQYALLSGAFAAEREVKENADKIELMGGEAVTIDANTKAEEEAKKNESEEIVIKNYHAPKAKESVAPTPSDTPTPQAEESVEPSKPQFETQVLRTSVPGAKEGNEAFNAEIKIVDKIDLSALNTKVRPDKKSRKEKAKEEAAEKKAKKAKKAEEHTQPEPAHEPAPVEEKPTVAEEPVPQPEPQPQPEPEKAPEKTVEFIETQYQKLEGPKTVGKIDLSQFDKAKPEGEKRKRKRLKGQKVDEKAAAEKAAKDDRMAKAGKQGKDQNPNNNQSRNKEKANKQKSKERVVEVDDAEIEKQIRDTLARLSPMGKSKTSKHNREKRQKVHMRVEEEMMQEEMMQKTLQVTEFVTANELATMMNTPVTQIIATCMSVGIFVSINQRLDAEAIKLIADEFGFEINFVSNEVAEAIHNVEEADRPEDLEPRNPIVTVMGHVDHGKTSLLDYIRKTNVIAGEAGGITQHIGAYEVTTSDGRKITFLDTPGHEAFTAMRARGAKVTDIAIIVISAVDRIMPQTIEAINHAQAAGVPIVFAINKIDKPGADPDKIKTELAKMNLLVEEWGGKYQSQDISAKQGTNVDLLLEKVLLEAEMLELKGNPHKRAKGTVLECSLDKGRGYVAKLLVEDGTIRQGDPIVAGPIAGRVKAMYNERNQMVKEAGPSQPVLLLGLTGACQAGDTFNVMENEKEAKDIANESSELFDALLSNRIIIAERIAKDNPQWIEHVNQYQYDSIAGGYFPKGYGPASLDVLMYSFIAAYTGKDAKTMKLNPFPTIPLPNWTVSYNGLTNIPSVAKLFKSVNITHSYKSTYTISSWANNVYYDPNNTIQTFENSDHIIPQYDIQQLVLNEQFAPLIGIDLGLQNSMTYNFQFKKSRAMTLSFTNNQLTEINGREIVIGAGYRIQDLSFNVVSLEGGGNKTIKNDLVLKVDLGFKRDKTILRRIDENNTKETGLFLPDFDRDYVLRADYTFSQRLSSQVFFKHDMSLIEL